MPSKKSVTITRVDSTSLENEPSSEGSHSSTTDAASAKMNFDNSSDTTKDSSSVTSLEEQSNREIFSPEQQPQEHSDLMLKILKNETPGCTCKKSKCLKLYCQCFAASAFCDKDKCKCETCKNDITRETEIKRARSNVLYRNPKAFEGKFTNTAIGTRKLPCIRRNFSAMRNPVGPYSNQSSLLHDPSFNASISQSGPSISSLHNASILNHHQKSGFDRFSRNSSQMSFGGVQVPTCSAVGGGSNGIERVSNEEVSISHKSGCKCRKSFCVKKYCECFQNGVKCGSNCRCVDCRNQPQGQQGIFSKVNMPVKMNTRDFMAPSSVLVGIAVPSSHSMDMGMNPTRAGCYIPFQGQQLRHAPNSVFPTQSLNPMYRIQEHCHRSSFDNSNGTVNVHHIDNYDDMRRTKMVLAAASATEISRNSAGHNIHHSLDAPTSTNDMKRVSSSQDRMALMAALAMTELATISNKKRAWQEDTDNTVAIVKKTRSNLSGITNVDKPIELATVSKSSSLSSNNSIPSPSNSISTIHSSSTDENRAPHKITEFPIQMAVAHALEQKAKLIPSDAQEDIPVFSNTKLPQSLSFRKICSKCGRSRNEHGELGFGNNCIFEDCAKCGASHKEHEKEGVQMGFHCSLTESGSPFAKAGMADCYVRKIIEMATMAKLKKDFITNHYKETDKPTSADVDAVQ